jgi:hypothetical protein
MQQHEAVQMQLLVARAAAAAAAESTKSELNGREHRK